MSRKDDSPAISLFSFQDIITSITGIMFLVVIMLMIFLFESKPESSDDPETAKMKKSVAAEITALQKSLDELKKEEERQKKALEELMKMSPEKIAARKRELEKKYAQAAQNLFKLQQEQNEMRLFIQNAAENIRTMQAKLAVDKEQLAKETLESAENKKNLENLKKQLEEVKKAATFSVENSSDKNFILAEFGKDGFMVKDFSAQVDHDLRIPGASADEHIDKFIDWVSTRDKNSELVSVIIGPANLKHWNEIANRLKKLSFGYGVEFYPDDNTTIFTGKQGGGI
ncbi:MAG: hypothetical protein E7051_08685 [Lentisphaerae bacterium]|nr:hypothetical protein [Lentisphaerota bacterium]